MFTACNYKNRKYCCNTAVVITLLCNTAVVITLLCNTTVVITLLCNTTMVVLYTRFMIPITLEILNELTFSKRHQKTQDKIEIIIKNTGFHLFCLAAPFF